MILDTIVAAKRRAHAERARERERRPLRDERADGSDGIAARAARREHDFAASLRPAPSEKVPRVIAEFKRRSPSAGDIRPGARARDVARAYVEAGAAALSVLTDGEFFGGALSDMRDALDHGAGPGGPRALRKDFVLYDEDLAESAEAGASAVLLIVRLLDDATLRRLHGAAERDFGLDVLVEVHDERELDRALAAGARLVGVNHRDLDTLAIDLALSERLAKRFPAEVTRVAESGLRTHDDLVRMRDRGYHAVLVGEALMRAGSPGDALRALRGASR